MKVKKLISKLGLNSSLYSHNNYQNEKIGRHVIDEASLNDDELPYYANQVHARTLAGKNFEKKSPLEKWFS